MAATGDPTSGQAVDPVLLLRKRVESLVHDWTEHYKEAAAERRRLHEHELDASDLEHSILLDLEANSSTVHGIALSFGNSREPVVVRPQVVAELRSCSLNENLPLLQWMAAQRDEYPRIVDLFERLDHTRLVLLSVFEGGEFGQRKAG
jgi:hypothetical protein